MGGTPAWLKSVAGRVIALDRAVVGTIERAAPPVLAHSRVVRELERAIGTFAGDCRGTLLDAGCGGRKFARLFTRLDRYIGMDRPDTRREMTYGASGVDVCGDVYRIPFAADSLDGVFSDSVLEHLEDPQAALREFHRILKPGGRLILTVPFLFQIHAPVHDFSRWTFHGLAALVRQAGFEIQRTIPVGGYLTTLWSMAEGYLLEYAYEQGTRWLPVKYLLRPLQMAACVLGNVLAAGLDRLWPSDRACALYVVLALKPG